MANSIEQERDVLAEIDELPELLPLPDVALKLMNACQDSSVGVKELCQIVSFDTSLSVRLLQISNSSLYGASGRIKTVEHASVVLGARGLRELALSVIAHGAFQNSKGQSQSVDALWRHSLGCATVAQVIAQNIDGVCPQEAFVAGIVHDVGKLVLIQVLQEEYDLVLRALGGEVVVEDEQRRYGICHTELGTRCAEEWGLPYEISEALENHHCPYDSNHHSRLSSVVIAANQLSKIWSIGNDHQVDITPQEISEATNLPFDELKLTELQALSASDFLENQTAFQG